jgi:hypothetical protein
MTPRADTEDFMFVPSMFLADPHDPRKRPERRWLRCRYLLHHGRRPSTADDDPVTWAAWRYFHGLGRCRDVVGRARLGRRFPAVAEAYGVYTSAEPLARAGLEARLLADEADEAIAKKTGVSAAGLAAYHDIFFCVRAHLRADSYVATVVLRGKAHEPLKLDQHEVLLKAYGYALGPRGVDDILDYLRDPPAVPASLDGLDPPALRRLRARLRTRVSVLAMTTPASAASPATWARVRQVVAAGRRDPQGVDDDGVALPGATRAAPDVVACPTRRWPGTGDPDGAARPADRPLLPVGHLGGVGAGDVPRPGEAVPA